MLRALVLAFTVFGTGCAASTAAPPRVVEHVVVVPVHAPVASNPPPQHSRARPHHQHHKHEACDHADHKHKPRPKSKAARNDAGSRDAHVHKDWEQAKKERRGEKNRGDEKRQDDEKRRDDESKGRDKRAPRASTPSTTGA